MDKQPLAHTYLSAAEDDSAPCLPPKSSSRLHVSSQTIAIASTATTLATIGAFSWGTAAPTYEGSIQLVGILPTEPAVAPSNEASEPLSSFIDRDNIAPPDLIEAIDDDLARNRHMAHTVTQALKQKGITLSQSALLDHLTASTSPQGWLELTYADSNAERVEPILAEVAEWYVSQDSSCTIQACDDVLFIKAQIPILEQKKQDLEQSIQDLYTTVSPPTASADQLIDINQRVQQLLIQQHSQIQHLAHVDTRLDELSAHLDHYQTQMHLEDMSTDAGFEFLRQVIPNYDAWLQKWHDSDRQLVALTLNRQIRGDLSSISILSPSAPTTTDHVEHLLAQQNRLHDEMKQALKTLAHQSMADMPAPMRQLIVEDVARFEPMERWVRNLHRLQLLETRRQTLAQLQQDTDDQMQEWQDAMAVKAQLQRELDVLNGTLTAYRDQYTVAQRQAAQTELTWQLVTPPEMVQQPQRWKWFTAAERSNRLVTLQSQP